MESSISTCSGRSSKSRRPYHLYEAHPELGTTSRNEPASLTAT
ncbi:hypothetical protein WEH80_39330 [Actinomycetes bacterium KLBMP 9759]